ncbi:MAG: hypothetical protein Q7R41_02690 [Phycisphaerales bacterium]|nr:hypothetical protein [Phycisphaerales bacterium]
MFSRCLVFAWLAVGFTVLAAPAHAAFHLMQIEQVIGGVNGDTTAQAVQLRTRSLFENFVAGARILVWDATGANPVLVIDFGQNVANGQAGDRVLVASANFIAATNPNAAPDFMMTNLIPASYLAAGSLTYEDDFGTILWRLSWGGAGYTGSTFGDTTNDNDPGLFEPANYGPPFPGPLPSTTLQALRFIGPESALSTSNNMDYAITSGAAVFANNARNSFTVAAPAPVVGDIDGDRVVGLRDHARCAACLAGPDDFDRPAACSEHDFTACDLDEDADVDFADFADFYGLLTAP